MADRLLVATLKSKFCLSEKGEEEEEEEEE
jgi:hypothetical protein